MVTSNKGDFVLVRTKTGKYCHPIRVGRTKGRSERGGSDDFRVSRDVGTGIESYLVRLGCMEHPTWVWLLSPEELIAMERGEEGAYKRCIACAMWIVYGQERGK